MLPNEKKKLQHSINKRQNCSVWMIIVYVYRKRAKKSLLIFYLNLFVYIFSENNLEIYFVDKHFGGLCNVVPVMVRFVDVMLSGTIKIGTSLFCTNYKFLVTINTREYKQMFSFLHEIDEFILIEHGMRINQNVIILPVV